MASRTHWATRLPKDLVEDLDRQWPAVHSLSNCTGAECGTCNAVYAARDAALRGDEPPQAAWGDEARALTAAYVAGLPADLLERVELYVLGDLSVSDEEMAEARTAAACGEGPEHDAYPTAALRALLDATLGDDALADADRDNLETVSDLVESLAFYEGHDPEVARPAWIADDSEFLGGRLVYGPRTVGEWDRGGRKLAGMGVAS